jgi:hypothetical protein
MAVGVIGGVEEAGFRMVQRFYLDTSVIGGVFEPEFERESVMFFELVKAGLVICLCSDVMEQELEKAPEYVRNFFEDVSDTHKERVVVTSEVLKLAQAYIDEKVIGEKNVGDCVHIAAATVYRADVLISWNFRHIVGLSRVRDYNIVNMKRGYRVLNIRSPREVAGALWNQN